MKDFEQWIPVLRQIAMQAGYLVCDIRKGKLQVGTKSDGSCVTNADLESDQLIRRHLQAAFPSIPIVSEESEVPQVDQTKPVFVVDPLDGTRDYVNGMAGFSINIGIVIDGFPVAGVIFVPLHERLYEATGNHFQAYDTNNGLMTKIACHDPERPARLTVVGSPFHRDILSSMEYNDMPVRYVSHGSALKFGMIAQGEAHMYVRPGTTMVWDTAAGQVMIEARGGEVIDCQTMSRLRYDLRQDCLANASFVAKGAKFTCEELQPSPFVFMTKDGQQV